MLEDGVEVRIFEQLFADVFTDLRRHPSPREFTGCVSAVQKHGDNFLTNPGQGRCGL
jgi:hypothetical protein